MPDANTNPNAKSKMAAGLLGIFLGSFGVHNFYLGYWYARSSASFFPVSVSAH